MNLGLSNSEARTLPHSRSSSSFHSLAGAVNELPGPKQGLALCWSQGALDSQNPHEVLWKERTPLSSLQVEANAKA